MADGRAKNGGHSTKGFAGRKSKSEELQLIEKLSPLEPIAFRALKAGLEVGNTEIVKLFFSYLYGKPKQQLELSGEITGIKQILIERASKSKGK